MDDNRKAQAEVIIALFIKDGREERELNMAVKKARAVTSDAFRMNWDNIFSNKAGERGQA